jgi:hypothetical protein
MGNISTNDAFASTDEEDVIESYSEVISWVQAQDQFLDAAKVTSPQLQTVGYSYAKAKVYQPTNFRY